MFLGYDPRHRFLNFRLLVESHFTFSITNCLFNRLSVFLGSLTPERGYSMPSRWIVVTGLLVVCALYTANVMAQAAGQTKAAPEKIIAIRAANLIDGTA